MYIRNIYISAKLKSVHVHLAHGSEPLITVYTSTRYNWNVTNICCEKHAQPAYAQ